MSSNVKNSIWYSMGQYINLIVKFIFNLFAVRILGPAITGSFAFANVIYSYVDFLYAPIRAYIEREVPYLKGSKENEKVTKVLNNSYTTTFIGTIIGCLILLIYALYTTNAYVKYAILIMIPYNYFYAIANYNRIYLKTEKKFVSISKIYILIGFIQAIITLVLTLLFHYYGYGIGLVIGTWIMHYLYSKNLPHKFKFDLQFDEIKRIYQQGIPLIVYSFVMMNFQNVDKIMIKHYLSISDLGIYNMGTTFFSNLWIIPLSVYGVYYTNLMEMLGKKDEKGAIDNVIQITYFMRAVLPFVIGISWVAIPVLFTYVIPAFKSGILSSQLLLVGLYFNSLHYMHYCYIIGKKKVFPIILYSIFSLAFACFANVISIKLGFGLNGIAATKTIAYFVFSCGIEFISLKIMNYSKTFYFKSVIHNLVWSIPILILPFVETYLRFNMVWIKAIIVFIIFILMDLPFLIAANHKFQIVKKIKDNIKLKVLKLK